MITAAGFGKQAGLNSFLMTPKRRIESTNASTPVRGSPQLFGRFRTYLGKPVFNRYLFSLILILI